MKYLKAVAFLLLVVVPIILWQAFAMKKYGKDEYQRGWDASEQRFETIEKLPMWIRSLESAPDQDKSQFALKLASAPSVLRDCLVVDAYKAGKISALHTALALKRPKTHAGVDCLQDLKTSNDDQVRRVALAAQ